MNQVILIGRLVRDPELRFIAGSGQAVANFTLAVDKNLSREKKQQFESQGKPTADFIRVVVWGKRAETCANYLQKGGRVAVEGSISVNSYKAQSGETRYTTDVVANNVEFIDWGDKKQDMSQQQRPAGDFQAFDNDFANDFKAIEDDDDIPF